MLQSRLLLAMLKLDVFFIVLGLLEHLIFEFLRVFFSTTLVVSIMRGFSLCSLSQGDFFGSWHPFIFFFFDWDRAWWRMICRR